MSNRHRAVRSHTISHRVLLRVVRDEVTEPALEGAEPRPRTRGDCVGGERPCPYVSCKHHLFLDVTDKGSIKLNFPDIEPEQLEVSCALDVADEGGSTLDEVSAAMNITRERVRQIEAMALPMVRGALDDFRDEDGGGPRRHHHEGGLRAPEATEAEDETEDTDDEDQLVGRVWRTYERNTREPSSRAEDAMTDEQEKILEAMRELARDGEAATFPKLIERTGMKRGAIKAALEPLRGTEVDWPERGPAGVYFVAEAKPPKQARDEVVVSLTAARRRHGARLASLERKAKELADEAATHVQKIARIDQALAAFDAGTDLANATG